MKLEQALQSWGSDQFPDQLKEELEQSDPGLLPLQQGLSHSSYVGMTPPRVVVLNSADSPEAVQVKVGIFYGGVDARTCCSDDPTPPCEKTEYCELQLVIDKASAETQVTLLDN
ncbi:MAG: hypothetical protein MI754_07370 [Chromatiales bacterium]|nr:hypothetical protein [Chromatiales bacterium]